MANAKTGRVALAARDLETRATELRLAGKSFRTIARELNCTPSGAHGAVSRALDRTLLSTTEHAAHLRDIELARLDAMLAGLWDRATTGDVPSVVAALRIGERRARLLGLDAPERRELTGPDGGPLSFLAVATAWARDRQAEVAA